MPTLLIDDQEVRRKMYPTDKVCTTYDEGIEALKSQTWDILYLDHDLGERDDRKTGYGIACWLEANPQYAPKGIVIITDNPVGRKNMEMAINSLYRRIDLDKGEG